jgi:hypothetical protein
VQRIANQNDLPMTPVTATSDAPAINIVLGQDGRLWNDLNGWGNWNLMASNVVSVSEQGIDSQGGIMVDYVTKNSYGWTDAYEWHEIGGTAKHLAGNVRDAKAGQETSYLLYNDGSIDVFNNSKYTMSLNMSPGVKATQIDVGIGYDGVNTLAVICNNSYLWTWRADWGWVSVAQNVKSVSSGRGALAFLLWQGSAFGIDSDGAWHFLGSNLSQVTAGTDGKGNATFLILGNDGTLTEDRLIAQEQWNGPSPFPTITYVDNTTTLNLSSWVSIDSIDKMRLGVADMTMGWSNDVMEYYDPNHNSYWVPTSGIQTAV